ncbi:MAG: PIG-L family deacetylase [Anaerolineae bacterium]|nr:PIG-L family deacetylase [Anaerolineae bacterium]
MTAAAVVVAHPDDETLWAGGEIMAHPDLGWVVVSLCRASDPDRARRFAEALRALGATGVMGDLDDSPDQPPLSPEVVEKFVFDLLPARRYVRVLTHGPRGEYTRHRRHEETCRAVLSLWCRDAIEADEVWLFAYEDDGEGGLPRPAAQAQVRRPLSPGLWQRKLDIVTRVYGFAPGSWEFRAAPQEEAFQPLRNRDDARAVLARACRREGEHA